MRYQLRYAAGSYWLLDTCQEGVPYRRPLSMNEVGADIWKLLIRGLDREQIVKEICREYQVAEDTVLPDVEQFLERLAEYGISVPPGEESSYTH